MPKSWGFKMIHFCSDCGESQCEMVIFNIHNHKEKYYVRDCDPKTYENLPREIRKEMFDLES